MCVAGRQAYGIMSVYGDEYEGMSCSHSNPSSQLKGEPISLTTRWSIDTDPLHVKPYLVKNNLYNLETSPLW